MEALKGATDWEAELARIRDPNLQLPAYYTQPFHAYPEGNLCWEAALQVHTPIFTCSGTAVALYKTRRKYRENLPCRP